MGMTSTAELREREAEDAFARYLGWIAAYKAAALGAAALGTLATLWLTLTDQARQGAMRVGGYWSTPIGDMVFTPGFVLVWLALAIAACVALWLALRLAPLAVAICAFVGFAFLLGPMLAITLARLSPPTVLASLSGAAVAYAAVATLGLTAGRRFEPMRRFAAALAGAVLVCGIVLFLSGAAVGECIAAFAAILLVSCLAAMDAQRALERWNEAYAPEENRRFALLSAVESTSGFLALYAWIAYLTQRDGGC